MELIWRKQESDTSHLASLGISPTGHDRREKLKIDMFHVFVLVYPPPPQLVFRAGNISKSPGHFPECDVIRGGGEGVLANIEIT